MSPSPSMTRNIYLLVWALTLQILPLRAQEEDHSNDDIQDPNSPISLTTKFHCINIYKTDPTLDPSQTAYPLCPDDPPFHSYNYDIWLTYGFPHDGAERTSPTQYLRPKWLSHVLLSWSSDTAVIDERYSLTERSWVDEQRSQTKKVIRRSCNPLKSADLNPYWVDFVKKGDGDRDALTWAADDGGSIKYDKGIRNSLCGGGGGGGKDDDDDDDDDGGGKEKYGPFNMDGFTKGSKSATGTATTTTTTTTTSALFPVGETSSFGSVDDGTNNTPSPPFLSSTSFDEDIGKAIDTTSSSSSLLFSSVAPSSPSLALQDNNKYNDDHDDHDDHDEEEDTIRFDSKLFTRRRRTRTKKRTSRI